MHTIVQHSGAGYAGKEGFAKGLETRWINGKRELNRVLKAGGLVFGDDLNSRDGYKEAEEFAEKAMYPEGHNSIYPNAQGTFSDLEIDELKIYIPVRQTIG